MRSPVVAATLLAALAASPSCSPAADVGAARGADKTQAIINGERCTESEFPTAMAILLDATINFGGGSQDITTVMCTGTLIAPDVVLTAAHCTDPSLLTFGFGTVERADFYVTFQSDLEALAAQTGEPAAIPESAVPVRDLIAHEGFDIDEMNQGVNGPGDFKDIALLFLAVTIDDVQPDLSITADEATHMQAGVAVSIAGWGQQTPTQSLFEPPPPGTVGIKVCGESTINEVGEFEIQIGGDATTTRKCHGDSGGPTYLDLDTGRRVIGITSHAYDQEDCNKGGVDTRVDVWLPWIDARMVERCADASRVWCDVDGIIPPDFDPAAPGDEDPEEEDGDDDDPAPTGCASAAPPAAPLALAALLLALRRRRR